MIVSEMLLSDLRIAGTNMYSNMAKSTGCPCVINATQLLVCISFLQEISLPPPKLLAEPAAATSTIQRYSVCPLTRT